MSNIENLARFIALYIYSEVLENEELLANRQLIESVNITNLNFNPETMRQECLSVDPARDARLEKLGAEFIKQFRKAAGQTCKSTKPMLTAISITAGAKFA
jgi:hypothetical protein